MTGDGEVGHRLVSRHPIQRSMGLDEAPMRLPIERTEDLVVVITTSSGRKVNRSHRPLSDMNP